MTDQVTLFDDQGNPTTVPTVSFTVEEAQLLRKYKRLLETHGLREALYCNRCFEQNQRDGLDAHVTPDRILFRCRCTVRIFTGTTL